MRIKFQNFVVLIIVIVVITCLVIYQRSGQENDEVENDSKFPDQGDDLRFEYYKYITVVDPPEEPDPISYIGTAVPENIHQIWLGLKDVPSETSEWLSLSTTYGYKYTLWLESDILNFGLENLEEFQDMLSREQYAGASDIARYEILNRFGGLYVDSDTVPADLPIFNFLNQTGFGASPEHNPRKESLGNGAVFLANGFLVSSPNHPILERVIESLPLNFESLSSLGIYDEFMITGPCLLNASLTGVYHVIDKNWIMTDQNNSSFHLVEFNN